MTKKKRDRPAMPAAYGIPKGTAGMLPWKSVEKRLADAHNYWIVTARPDGRPHAMPVWGIWVHDMHCFGTDRGSRKARNLAANRSVAVHLDDGNEPVIVEGTALELVDDAVIATVDKAYHGKYKMHLTDAPGDLILFSIRPLLVLAWREKDFPGCATRWRFEKR